VNPRVTLPAAAGALAAATLGYSLVEARSPRLRRVDLPVLPAGAAPLRILHISDLHVTPGQRWKIDWLRRLAQLDPDLVVDTGDNLAHRDAVPAVLAALGPLLDRPGLFVGGSNDYFAPRPKNPVRYLLPDGGRRVRGRPLPWGELRAGLRDRGWLDLTNRRHRLTVAGRQLAVAGVNDPHLRADRYGKVAGPVPAGVEFGLAVVHAPEPRVLDLFERDGFALILAGHTHGGQLRVPGVGALVTNCGLDTGRARGLSRWGRAWLHVSAGVGTSPFAPVRFACPPEATLLTLVAGRG
jgi:predicted MPP superfamily phosphohydrolase